MAGRVTEEILRSNGIEPLPDSSDTAREWRGGAKKWFAAVAARIAENGNTRSEVLLALDACVLQTAREVATHASMLPVGVQSRVSLNMAAATSMVAVLQGESAFGEVGLTEQLQAQFDALMDRAALGQVTGTTAAERARRAPPVEPAIDVETVKSTVKLMEVLDGAPARIAMSASGTFLVKTLLAIEEAIGSELDEHRLFASLAAQLRSQRIAKKAN